MNKIIISVGVVVLIVIGVLVLGGDVEEVNNQEDIQQQEVNNEVEENAEDTGVNTEEDEEVVETASAGTYIAYSASALSQSTAENNVLFFKASWCPTCRILDADIKASLTDIPSGTAIFEVDYDTNQELRKKYGVTVQHTLVQVDSEGNLVAKWTGGGTLESVLSKLQ